MSHQSGSMRSWTAIMIILVCCLATSTNGSAIPMWEFLTRDEKMSHLYKLFTKQVARYCSDSSLPDCNKSLLIAGIRNLASVDENELDRMDPYQRGADDTIWHAMVRDTRLPAKYGHENSYYMAEDDPLATGESDHNGLGEGSARIEDYVRPSDHSGPYLVGPMVIRVFPDGRPVPEDAEKPLPRDEDAEEMRYSKIPSIAEIETNGRGFFYERPSYDSLIDSNKLGVYVQEKPVRRLDLVPTIKNNYYRRFNPLFRNRRVSEISSKDRTLRFY